MKVVPIPLPVPQPQDRIVKRGAAFAFRTLFAVAEQAKKAPGLFKQAADDVRTAWQETAHPNV